MNKLSALALSCVLMFVGRHAEAQRPARAGSPFAIAGEVTVGGVLNYEFPLSSIFDAPLPAIGIATGVPIPGDCSGWVSADGVTYNYLVSGRMASGVVGLVEHWTWASEGGAPPQLSSVRFWPNTDIASAAYDPKMQKLYVFDVALASIVGADWDGVTAVPASYVSVITSVECPALAAPEDHIIRCRERFAGTTRDLTVEVYRDQTLPSFVKDPLTYVNTSTVPGTTQTIAPLPVGRGYGFMIGTLSEGATSVELRVAHDSTDVYEVYDAETSQLIGSSSALGTQSTLTVPVSPALVVGGFYVVRKVGDSLALGYKQECRVRYGNGETTPMGVSLDTVRILPLVEVGEQSYEISLTTQVMGSDGSIAGPDGELGLTGHFAIGFRDPVSGIDPVALVGSQWLLQTGIYLPASGLIVHLPGKGSLSIDSVPMPYNPSMAGLVVFAQALYIEGSSFYVSEVVGFSMVDS